MHRLLNDKIEKIAGEQDFCPPPHPRGRLLLRDLHHRLRRGLGPHLGLLAEMDLLNRVDLYQVTIPYPLHQDFISHIKSRYQHALVLEETYPVIELQLAAPQVRGRAAETVP